MRFIFLSFLHLPLRLLSFLYFTLLYKGQFKDTPILHAQKKIYLSIDRNYTHINTNIVYIVAFSFIHFHAKIVLKIYRVETLYGYICTIKTASQVQQFFEFIDRFSTDIRIVHIYECCMWCTSVVVGTFIFNILHITITIKIKTQNEKQP